jgi:hypothetical protein
MQNLSTETERLGPHGAPAIALLINAPMLAPLAMELDARHLASTTRLEQRQ